MQTIDPVVVNEAQFTKGYAKGFPITFRFLISLGANPDAAEEVSQAAWARGWQYRDQLMNPAVLGTWVNSIARNLYWTHARSENKLTELADYQTPPTAQRLFEASSLISHCSPVEWKMLTLFYIEGFTTKEIAELEGLCPITVRVRLMRLRRHLRHLISPSSPSLNHTARVLD